MLVIHNGQQSPVDGWYMDRHGHQMLIREGDLAPICPHQGPMRAMWRLVRELGRRVRAD